jgi:hypothetical protein
METTTVNIGANADGRMKDELIFQAPPTPPETKTTSNIIHLVHL